MVPEILTGILDHIQADPRTELAGSWTQIKDGRWSLPLVARLTVPPTVYLSTLTTWHLVVGPNLTDSVHLYPDGASGLDVTFQHQDYNAPANEFPWRSGKPCLERPVFKFGRVAWDDEPTNLAARMVWKIGRLLQWIDAAASGTLAVQGDPLELPAYPGRTTFPVIGFSESPADLIQWEAEENRWGFARIALIPNAKDTSVITEFLDPDGRSVLKIPWTSTLASASSIVSALWIRLPSLPVNKPWQLPMTWRELSERIISDKVDLREIIVRAGIHYRKNCRPTRKHHLLLGFPLCERIGEVTRRIHWLALGNVHLVGRDEKRDGFRPVEDNRRRWDRQMAGSATPLKWRTTANWAPDQLRTRGAAEDAVRSKRILVIGAGTLGAAVAENLLRMGVTTMGVMDGDCLEVGNLCRHILTMNSVGHNKAVALVSRLNTCMPDATAYAFASKFPSVDDKTVEAVRSFDVIVDCTASDLVLDALATFDWQGEKLFVSLAMTWRSEGLLAYSASEASFPAVDAKERFAATPTPDVGLTDANHEGIGCWHAVFPATAADVQLWAAIGTKFVHRAILDPARRCDHFRQRSDGTVERHDV